MDEIKVFAEIVKAYHDFFQKHPQEINILKHVAVQENHHTKFLVELLNYKRDGKNVFLPSFLNAMLEKEVCHGRKWNITFQDNHIDCSIISVDNEIAVIIENKVCGAMDQVKQLETYINAIKKRDISEEHIYVVYLTLFGGSPSVDSLSEKSRSVFGDRFKEKNYNNDIIHWLNNNVLPECQDKEKKLITSLELYIDYLHQMLGINEHQEKLAESLMAILTKNGINDYDATKKLLNEVSKYADSNVLCEAINSVLRDYERKNIFLNETLMADNLKWILKNDPSPLYKSKWAKGNFAPFNTITKFIYDKHHYIQLMANIDTKPIYIHLLCTFDGVKKGPYITAESTENVASICDVDQLLKGGFRQESNYLEYPFEDLNASEGLIEVALHIQNMVKKIREARR